MPNYLATTTAEFPTLPIEFQGSTRIIHATPLFQWSSF